MNENQNFKKKKSFKKVRFSQGNVQLPLIKRITTLKGIILNENTKNLIKRELDEKLSKLFSSPSSLLGYKFDVESLLNDLHINKEVLLKIVLEFLSKSMKNENEQRIIAAYLFSMQGLINLLLKTINLDEDKFNQEKKLLNNLLVLGSALVHEKYPKNYILIHFGEKGSKAYINLSGQVAVLIKKQYHLLLNEEEYLLYLANLIKYNEYELVNIVINENFKTFPIDIIDDIDEQDYNIRNTTSTSVKDLDKFNNLFFEIENEYALKKKSSKDTSNLKLINKASDKLKKMREKRKAFSRFRLNQENEKSKELSTPFTIYASELMKKHKLKFINKKKLNKCTVDQYIKRINVINGFNFNEVDFNNKNANQTNRAYFTIYSYINVVNLPKGSLFGEMALNNKNSLRNATIITLDECHCGVLNKTTYNKCLKNGAEKNLYDILYFIVELPIFKGIPTGAFFRKYYTSLSRNIINKQQKIITQGKKPEYIILLKSGQYTIYTYNSLYNITNLMIHYLKISQKSKKRVQFINNLILSLKSTNKILMDNDRFKNYYLSKYIYKVGEISFPDIITYNEYLDEDGNYAFSIEPKTINNEVFFLKNTFYEDIIKRNEIVRNNQEEIFYSKLELIFERLYNMRKAEINTFLEMKAKEEIGVTINKEINCMIDDKIKIKRIKKFNTIDYNINLKEKEKRNLNNEINYLETIKKSSIMTNSKQIKNKKPILNLKETINSENNISSINSIKNENKNKNSLLELTSTKNKFFSPNLSDKNYKNKTIDYFFNHNLKIKKNSKSKFEKKTRIEKYSQKKMNNKKNDFDGVCLNNMILEDIKDQIQLSFLDDKKIFKRNRSKKKELKKFIFSEKLFNSVKNNKIKKENDKSLSSMQNKYLKTMPLSRISKEKKDKKNNEANEIDDKKINNNKILLYQYNEIDTINYDMERSNYYKKTISKRMNFFFGNKRILKYKI